MRVVWGGRQRATIWFCVQYSINSSYTWDPWPSIMSIQYVPLSQFFAHGMIFSFNQQRPTSFVDHLFLVIPIQPYLLASPYTVFNNSVQAWLICCSLNITLNELFSPSPDIHSAIDTHSQLDVVVQNVALFSTFKITFTVDVTPNVLPFSSILYVSSSCILCVTLRWRYKSNHSINISSVQFCARFSSKGRLYLVWSSGCHWKKWWWHFSERGLVSPRLTRNSVAISRRYDIRGGQPQDKDILIQPTKTTFSVGWIRSKYWLLSPCDCVPFKRSHKVDKSTPNSADIWRLEIRGFWLPW